MFYVNGLNGFVSSNLCNLRIRITRHRFKQKRFKQLIRNVLSQPEPESFSNLCNLRNLWMSLKLFLETLKLRF